MRGAVAAGLVLVCLARGVHPRVQAQGDVERLTAARSAKLVQWLAAVDGHQPGDLDGSVVAIASWPRRDLLNVVAEWLSKSPPRDPGPRLKRAAILHTDIAILFHHDSGYDRLLTPSTHTATAISDGRASGVSDGTAHWEFARLLLDNVRPAPASDPDVRTWYRATSALLESWSDYAELHEHITRALRLFPNDPVLLLIAGSQHEAYAEAKIQGPLDMMRGLGIATIGAPTPERDLAIGFLQRALAADPRAPEPRIRLGRLLGLRGRHDDARRELQQALALPLPPVLEYYAQLFLGTEQAAVGQPVAARSAFERAEALYPRAQSPRLAMSRLLRDGGDREGALAAVLGIARDAETDADPWWDYAKSHVPDADALVAGLRAEAVQWPQ